MGRQLFVTGTACWLLAALHLAPKGKDRYNLERQATHEALCHSARALERARVCGGLSRVCSIDQVFIIRRRLISIKRRPRTSSAAMTRPKPRATRAGAASERLEQVLLRLRRQARTGVGDTNPRPNPRRGSRPR